jgi:hypothetical protein
MLLLKLIGQQMILSKNNKFFFVHIPKAGGTSVANAMKKHKIDFASYGDAHSTIENILDINAPTVDYYIVQVRNPYNKFYSGYHYNVEWTKKRFDGELPLKNRSKQYYKDKFEFLKDITFKGWINLLTNKNKLNEFTSLFNEKNLFRLQKTWIECPVELKNKVKVFKVETGLIWSFINSLGFNITKTHSKKSTYKTQKGYTEEQAEIVYKYFEEDFKEFNYDKEDYERA